MRTSQITVSVISTLVADSLIKGWTITINVEASNYKTYNIGLPFIDADTIWVDELNIKILAGFADFCLGYCDELRTARNQKTIRRHLIAEMFKAALAVSNQ